MSRNVVFLYLMVCANIALASPVAIKQWQKENPCEAALEQDPLAALIRDFRENRSKGFDVEALQLDGQGELALNKVPVIDVQPTNFPAIVMYSGPMCIWCDLILPTYARVSPEFPELNFFYTKDRDLRKSEGIFSTPQLVLYKEGLKVQALGFGRSTSDFIQVLEILKELSRSNLKGHFAILDRPETRELYSVTTPEKADQIVSGKIHP